MALTTLEKVKQYCLGGRAALTTFDTRLQQLLTAAESEVESFCKRQFLQATETVILDGNGRNALRLPRWPVTAVASVKVDPDRAFGAGTTVDASLWILKGEAGLLRRANDGIWVCGEACIQVSYTGGYAVIPDDLQQAIAEIVADRFTRSQQLASGTSGNAITSESLSFQGSASFANEVSELSPFPVSAERILRSKYRCPF